MWSVEPLLLSTEERTELEQRVRAETTPHRDRQRAAVVLLAADGAPGRRIAVEVGLSPQAVSKWRIRFRDFGLEGLEDAQRSGRPLVYGPIDRLVLMAKVTSELPGLTAQRSHAELHDAMAAAGIAISASQIGRILAKQDVRPHKVEGWSSPKDTPEFSELAADVCGLYLSPPENAVVLSIDEKTRIEGKSSKHSATPVRPGRPARSGFEYARHGTASLLSAFEGGTGTVTATDAARNDPAHFTAFLEEIEEKTDPDLAIHVVLDDGSSHISKTTKAWFALRPRFVVHHTPAHASWLDQVECFCSILTRKALRPGEFASRQELVAKLMLFIAHYSESAAPFRWVYDAKMAV